MDELKTVETSSLDTTENGIETTSSPIGVDAIYAKENEDVAKMRASLLSCSKDPITTARALKNITTLRVYHQLARIIKYTEMCDKIEAKMYEAIDYNLRYMDISENKTLPMLIGLQEQLQKILIDSHKLLEPYLDITKFTMVDAEDVKDASDNIYTTLLDSSGRDKLRTSARAVLEELTSGEPSDDE